MLLTQSSRRCAQHLAKFLPRLMERCQSDSARSNTVDFGFEEVPEERKQSLVEQVFTSVAPKYDLMNDLMSAGMHRLWKDRLVDQLQPFAGMKHLDVAGGTGDVAFRVLKAIRAAELQCQTPHKPGSVCVFDINAAMLKVGQQRAKELGLSLDWVEGNAEELPFDDNSFDSYTIAFGIRNVTHRDKALEEAYRVLRPGGRVMVLEFSHVHAPGLKELYDVYSLNVIPQIGRLVSNDEGSYRYLVESIRKFPDQEAFAQMVREAGFKHVTYNNLNAGIVAIHSGFKL